MLTIVIPDDYQDAVRRLACFDRIRHHRVITYRDTVHTLAEQVARFAAADVLVLTRERTRVSAELLAALPRLKLIAQTGKLHTHVDVAACQREGVRLTEGSGAGTATTELTLLLILASLRQLVPEVQRLQQGLWQGSVGRQLNGRVLGIYGYGRLGRQLARVGQALGARVLVHGRPSTLERAQADGLAVTAERDELFVRSDVLSLQLRLNEATRGVVTARELALMKPDALLVNTARAELIAPGALAAALRAGRPGMAAVDVYDHEPVQGDEALVGLPNCLCTPHLGFVEQDNYEAYFGQAFDSILAHEAELLAMGEHRPGRRQV